MKPTPKGPAHNGRDGKGTPSYLQYRLLATASSMGLAVVIAIFLGLGLGMLLDKHLGTKPWCMVAGLLLGVAAGFRNLVVMANRVEKGEKQIEQELNRSLQRVGVSPGYPADEPKTDRANGPSEKAGDTGDEKG